jgi:hypothetical protein
MADRYVFTDDAGNADFSRKPGATRYHVLTTVAADGCQVGDDLLALRRSLGWKGLNLEAASPPARLPWPSVPTSAASSRGHAASQKALGRRWSGRPALDRSQRPQAGAATQAAAEVAM